MEHAPFAAEPWSDHKKQQLFKDLHADLVSYGKIESHADAYTGMPTGMRVHTMDATEALRCRWVEDAEDVESALLSHTPAHTDSEGDRQDETVVLFIESTVGTDMIVQDYQMTFAAGTVEGKHTVEVVPPENAKDIDRLLAMTMGRPQAMDTWHFQFMEELLVELQYQRNYE